MPPWIINFYVASGVVMAIGLYFTIRNCPFCILKNPKREEAMQLYRKKIMNEPMSIEEIKQNEFYVSQTSKYNFGDFLLSIAIPIHVFTGLDWCRISNLYFISILLMALSFLPRVREDLSYCFVFNYQKNDRLILHDIDIYLKGKKGEFLDKFDLNKYENERFDRLFSSFYRYSVNTGVILHLVLDVWFGLITYQ